MKSWEQVSLATVFAIAMGFLEAAVVVYLRKLYYPEGFAFPLKPLPDQVAFTELGRELSTLVMLVSAGLMLGRNGLERFAYFLLTFAVWDLVYYGGLKLVLDWPASLLTWDILFLIPLPWTGPVLAPVCAAISMIVLGLLLIRAKERHSAAKVRPLTWVWLIGGSVVFILACVWDYTTFVVNNYGWASLYTTEQDALFAINRQYTPRDFNWFLFGLAMLLIWTGIGSFGWRNRYYL